ncbi:ATP-binding protein [Lactiplantibacillus plantarum]|uniref:ATP-binding protein n=1 Tax=Lactiplantibacillus plantarum TaxID=1590 RepID=UPI0036F1CE7E
MMTSKRVGVIVGVDGTVANVGVYDMSNAAEVLWFGEILTGPKIGALLTINQNDVKIIASVITEKVIDQQNTIKSVEFDNRYKKNSINRVIQLKTRGVIVDDKFQVTSSYVPMVGNEVTLTTKDDLNKIYSIDSNDESMYVGKSILENQPVEININNFFASHIGIFGNTGSGKSNTLQKLYLDLFHSQYGNRLFKKSQFFVIDFNGEYGGKQFNIGDKKRNFVLNTRVPKDRVFITKDYLFDSDILSILFSASVATQTPFLKKAVSLFNREYENTNFDFGKFVCGTLKKILTSGASANQDSLQDWIQTAKKYSQRNDIYSVADQLQYNASNSSYYIDTVYGRVYFNSGSDNAISDMDWSNLKGANMEKELSNYWKLGTRTPIEKLEVFLDFQRVHRTAWGKINRDHLNPLFNRIDSAFSSLSKVVEVVDNVQDKYYPLNVFSLVHTNQDIKRVIPMMLSKMFYDIQKESISGKSITQTKHLIIDEAHNILNAQDESFGDTWQDYRLRTFEEIIKEGRKFGFYLTISSQRPADISATILSQVHNYIIHRLVNDKDLSALENTMPTLDRSSFQMIPSLGKGEAVITGNAMQIPVFVRIPKVRNKELRPNSDDVVLTELWKTR